MNKSHPALQPESWQSRFTVDPAFDEFEAAERIGYDTYWSKSREERAVILGYVSLKDTMQIIRAWEQREAAKNKDG